MKYVAIGTVKADVASNREVLQVFTTVGAAEGTIALMAGLDGRTFVSVVETDDSSALYKINVTYMPYFEEFVLIPVRDLDESVVAEISEAQGNWPT